MNRTGDPSVEVLLARIAALEAENRQLTERVVKLEEELALARLHRFAPKSEKRIKSHPSVNPLAKLTVSALASAKSRPNDPGNTACFFKQKKKWALWTDTRACPQLED